MGDNIEEIIEKDVLYKRLERVGPIVTGDSLDLKELLKNTTLLRALNAVRIESTQKAELLRNADLSTQQGINNALKLQGESSGLLRAIDCILDIAYNY